MRSGRRSATIWRHLLPPSSGENSNSYTLNSFPCPRFVIHKCFVQAATPYEVQRTRCDKTYFSFRTHTELTILSSITRLRMQFFEIWRLLATYVFRAKCCILYQCTAGRLPTDLQGCYQCECYQWKPTRPQKPTESVNIVTCLGSVSLSVTSCDVYGFFWHVSCVQVSVQIINVDFWIWWSVVYSKTYATPINRSYNETRTSPSVFSAPTLTELDLGLLGWLLMLNADCLTPWCKLVSWLLIPYCSDLSMSLVWLLGFHADC
jgi:hypothetical protein